MEKRLPEGYEWPGRMKKPRQPKPAEFRLFGWLGVVCDGVSCRERESRPRVPRMRANGSGTVGSAVIVVVPAPVFWVNTKFQRLR